MHRVDVAAVLECQMISWVMAIYLCIYLFNVYEYLPAYSSMYHMCACCLRRPEEGIGTPGTVVAEGYELPYGWQELNPCLLQEQLGLLPLTEPFLQLQYEGT